MHRLVFYFAVDAAFMLPALYMNGLYVFLALITVGGITGVIGRYWARKLC